MKEIIPVKNLKDNQMMDMDRVERKRMKKEERKDEMR